MTKPISTESFEQATGKSWQQWVKELDARGARDMTHKDLARQLYDELDGKLDNHGWWAQGITVAYEQHTGKRLPGQATDGTFELAVSKTIASSREELFARVSEWLESQASFNNQSVTKPRSSVTPRRSTWRCDFPDKSKFSATVEASGEKSRLILTHASIPTKQLADNWKLYWGDIIKDLASQ